LLRGDGGGGHPHLPGVLLLRTSLPSGPPGRGRARGGGRPCPLPSAAVAGSALPRLPPNGCCGALRESGRAGVSWAAATPDKRSRLGRGPAGARLLPPPPPRDFRGEEGSERGFGPDSFWFQQSLPGATGSCSPGLEAQHRTPRWQATAPGSWPPPQPRPATASGRRRRPFPLPCRGEAAVTQRGSHQPPRQPPAKTDWAKAFSAAAGHGASGSGLTPRRCFGETPPLPVHAAPLKSPGSDRDALTNAWA